MVLEVKFTGLEWLQPLVAKIHWELKEMAKTQAELAADMQVVKQQLVDVGDQVTKIGTETDSLLAKIEELGQVIAAGGNVTQELQDAFDAVQAQANTVKGLTQAVDEKVPDA